MYAFSNHIVQIDTLCLVCEKNENKQKDAVIGPCFLHIHSNGGLHFSQFIQNLNSPKRCVKLPTT